MAFDAVYVDPWRAADNLRDSDVLFDALLRGEAVHDDADDEQNKTNLFAKGLLLGATAIAPMLIRPSKVAAEDLAPNLGTKVVIIGDSLTVGRENAGLVDTLTSSGFDPIFVSSYGGRPLVLPGCDTKPVKKACYEFSDGVREVVKAAQQIDDAQIVMLNLGTNDQTSLLEDRLHRTIDKIVEVGSKQDGKAPVIILPEIFGESSRIGSAAKDEIIHAVAANYNASGIQVVVPEYKNFVDTAVRPAGHMARDEVHLTGDGYKQLIMFDIAQLLDIQKSFAPATTSRVTESADPLPRQTTYNGGPKDTDYTRSKQSASSALAAMPVELSQLPLVGEYKPPLVQDIVRYDLNMVSLLAVSAAKKQISITFAEPPEAVPKANLYTESTVQLPQDKLMQLDNAQTPQNSEVAGTDNAESLQQKADKSGIFYDTTTGRAMTHFKSFFDPAEIVTPEMRHGFREPRDLPDTDFYLHSNTDWHAPAGTTFVSPVPAVIIRYDDQYPGQKKGVGNSLVLVMGNDETGKPIVIQGTHFSEIFVNTGDIVMPGQPLAKAGETGIAYGAHFSVGMSDDSLDPYTNLDHSLNPIEYFDFRYNCAPSAMDDNGELCGSDGSPIALPVGAAVLNSLGLPEYNINEAVTNEPTVPPVNIANEFANIGPVTTTGLPLVDDKTTVFTDAVTPSETPDQTTSDTNQEQSLPPTFVQDIPPVSIPASPVNLPGVGDVTMPLDPTLPATDLPNNPDNPADTPPAQEPEDPTKEPPTEPTAPTLPKDQVENSENPKTEAIGTNTKLTFDDVAIILPNASMDTIKMYSPTIVGALDEQGIGDDQMICYTLATIHVETSGMVPLAEYGKGQGHDYGEPDPETGQVYYGRGFIQLTWKSNYETYGNALGIDLVNNPDLALDPTVSAKILALYMKNHEGGIRESLNAGDLKGARQIVNGRAAHGLAGFSDQYNVCQGLLAQKG